MTKYHGREPSRAISDRLKVTWQGYDRLCDEYVGWNGVLTTLLLVLSVTGIAHLFLVPYAPYRLQILLGALIYATIVGLMILVLEKVGW